MALVILYSRIEQDECMGLNNNSIVRDDYLVQSLLHGAVALLLLFYIQTHVPHSQNNFTIVLCVIYPVQLKR